MPGIAGILLNPDALRYIMLGVTGAKSGAQAWIDNREMQKTWATNANAIIDRAQAETDAGRDGSLVKPTPEEWAAVRDFENAAFAETQKPLTHEGPAAT